MFTLTFSKKVDGIRVPFTIDGIEQTLQVEADTKSSAIYLDETKAYCETHQVSVRRIS